MKKVSYRLENYSAKNSEQIDHKIRITYKLYSLNDRGEIRSCLGTNESLDRLLMKNERYMYKDRKYLVRKAVIETKEEPIFKVVQNRGNK